MADNAVATATTMSSGGLHVDDDGNIYFADQINHRIRFIPNVGGIYFGQSMTANCIYTIAGTGLSSNGGDNVLATSCGISSPPDVSVDAGGNIYIADEGNNVIRFVPKISGTYFGRSMTANYSYRIAGNNVGGYLADNVNATSTRINQPYGVSVDSGGNLYIADKNNHRVRFVPLSGGTYFGQSMTANYIYTIVGNGTGGYLADNVAATSTQINSPYDVRVDVDGNVYVVDSVNQRIRFMPKTSGTYYGQSMTATYLYTIAGNGTGGYSADNVAATSTRINYPEGISVDVGGNVYIADKYNNRIRFVPKSEGTYFGQSMIATYIYTIGGSGNQINDGGNALATSKSIFWPVDVFAGPGSMVYLSDANYKIRMIAGDDTIAPSTSTLTATAGGGRVTLDWNSAGNDGMIGTLTGNYRIQFATYTATWSTSTTPTNATTVTIATTSVTPGSMQTKVITGLTSGITYYFVLWSEDSANNWSGISNSTSAVPSVPNPTVTLTEAVGQAGWMGQGETQRILGTAEVVSDSASGVTISSVAVQASGYTADGNLTNVEVWVSSSGYIDANAVRLDGTAKAFSSNAAVFDQDVVVSTTPLYFIARSDVSGSATEGTFDIALQVYTTVTTLNNPIAFSNATDVVAPPSGTPSGLTATPSSNLLKVSLNWSGATGADSYSIFHATHSGVTTSDYFLGTTTATSLSDDLMIPNQLRNYIVVGNNRAGSSSPSAVASATTVDVPALTRNYIYLRAGLPAYVPGDGIVATNGNLNSPVSCFVDHEGNLYIADESNKRIRFVPKKSGTFFGQSMVANSIYSIAGTGTSAYNGDGAMATSRNIYYPEGVAVDAGGNVYIADKGNNRIRFIPKTGGTYFGQSMTANYIYTIAGNGSSSYGADNVAATSTGLKLPSGVSLDGAGNVYIADTDNYRIRFVPQVTGTYFGQSMTASYIYTIAGNGTSGFLADDVAATSTRISSVTGIAVDAGGNVYMTDGFTYRIRFMPKAGGTYFGQTMTANYLYTIAGNGTSGYLADNVAATSTRINISKGLSLDQSGNIYIADTYSYRIRFIPRAGGTYFGQSMTANYIYTIAGNGTGGYLADDVAATSTRIELAYGVTVDRSGNVYISDTINNRVRFVPKTSGTYFGKNVTGSFIYTIAGAGNTPYGGDNRIANSKNVSDRVLITGDSSGNLYVADYNDSRVRFVPKTGGTYFGQTMTANHIYTIAGNGTAGYLADDVAATSTRLFDPQGVAVDTSGNLYIADTTSNRVRFVPTTGGTYFGQTMTANYIYTIAGNGTPGYLADDVAATSTRLDSPTGVTIDSTGNVYIADWSNHRIRFVPKTGGTYFGQTMTANYIYTIAGNGTAGYLADNVSATSTRISYPKSVPVDSNGNIYISDSANHRIRFVPKTGGTYFGQAMTANYIYTIAGNGTSGYLADDVSATSTRINSPLNVNVDGAGNVYIADTNNNRIRFVAKAGGTNFGQSMTANYIYTIGGTGGTTYNGENALATNQAISGPEGLYVDADKLAYVADANQVVRMIAGGDPDVVSPSTSTLAAVTGSVDGTVDLSWASAGDDGMIGNLTGNYRIQYATYTASWSTSTTPTNATTVTIATTSVTPGSSRSRTMTGLPGGMTHYFVLWTQDESSNWSGISNTTSAVSGASTVTLAEAVGQAGWMGRGETQRILGTAQVVSDSAAGVTISSVAVQASGYTADGNLTNVEVWVSSSGYIDATAIRLQNTSKPFSSNTAVFTQNVVVSTTPLYFIARSDVGGSATEGTFELALQVYTTASSVNNPIAFSNATDVVAPPSGTPSGLTATAAGNLLQVNLSWSGATGADSYTIYRATHSGVTTTDFILGMTNSTSFADDTIPPNQLMYYKVVGQNRAGSTSLSNVASDTSVDVPALTTSNIYLRAGVPSGYGNGGVAYWDSLSPLGTMIDRAGNLYATDTVSRIKFTPKVDGTYFGQSMTAHRIYTIAGTGTTSYNGDGVLATTAHLNIPRTLAIDAGGNVYIADQSNHRIRFVPKTGGTYFGQTMTANYIYTIAGTGTGSYGGDGGAATSTPLNNPYGVSVDPWGNVAIADYSNHRIRFIAKTSGTYFGQSMTANNIYTIAGDGTGAYNGDNVVAT
ncbi:MAG: hypothetical protein JNK54_03120, partial [Elusimicrobia bacterium]|nr:hypothetical protein [Elusimicrobiota bacterium]